jgi:hypothetical protein
MILGWSINTEKFLRYCIENKVGTCSSYDEYDKEESEYYELGDLMDFQCLCLDSWCMKKRDWIPNGIYLVADSPYFDAVDDRQVYVSLLDNSKDHTLSQLMEVCNDIKVINDGYEIWT